MIFFMNGADDLHTYETPTVCRVTVLVCPSLGKYTLNNCPIAIDEDTVSINTTVSMEI